MIHEIYPHKFINDFGKRRQAQGTDKVLVFCQGKVVLVKKDMENDYEIPCIEDIECDIRTLMYLYTIDETAYFALLEGNSNYREGVSSTGKHLVTEPLGIYRTIDKTIGFAIITAWQLYNWKINNKYCGRCGAFMEDSQTERALVCPKCNNTVYPQISPAVTIAIINDDKILLAKSALGAFRKFALVAGYVEIGETFEETVRREVMEEVGLKVKDITYYKSQPWGTSSAQMIGFFVRLDGSDKVTIQESELSEARWFARDEIAQDLDTMSLSYEMIAAFRDGKERGILDGKKA